MKDRTHDEAMAELFKQDPAYALELLNGILEDGEQGELLIALRQMAKAFGGVQSLAKKANLNPTQLYRTLSEQGNPELRSLSAILKALGLRLVVERVRAALIPDLKARPGAPGRRNDNPAAIVQFIDLLPLISGADEQG